MIWLLILCGWIIAGACMGRLSGFTQKDGEFYVAVVIWPLVVLLVIGENIGKLIQGIAKRKE